MGSSDRHPRKSVKSSPVPRPTKSTSATAIPSPNHAATNSPYNTTSHSHQHVAHRRPTKNFSDASLDNNTAPHYSNTTHTQDTTDLNPMERFEQPSPFPYHQHTTYTPPSSSAYNNTFHLVAPSPPSSSTYINTSNSHHATSRDFSTQAQAGSYSEDVYSHIQHQNVYSQTQHHPVSSTQEKQYYSSEHTGYDGTWGDDDLSGVGQRFDYTSQAVYHRGDAEIEL
ncbi:uncharacterized protein PAC_05802 [Phialocephala subalpina]|uniref:Uncharacterized protein n=1 Tax=Phialocephala subalpina TaxID=576137 RepID=A0A1L7WT16_9HELO|nr:uncharacterized protein PAC_05802 [Phialocephala subalpina]